MAEHSRTMTECTEESMTGMTDGPGVVKEVAEKLSER
jgi:hypothetical protein